MTTPDKDFDTKNGPSVAVSTSDLTGLPLRHEFGGPAAVCTFKPGDRVEYEGEYSGTVLANFGNAPDDLKGFLQVQFDEGYGPTLIRPEVAQRLSLTQEAFGVGESVIFDERWSGVVIEATNSAIRVRLDQRGEPDMEVLFTSCDYSELVRDPNQDSGV